MTPLLEGGEPMARTAYRGMVEGDTLARCAPGTRMGSIGTSKTSYKRSQVRKEYRSKDERLSKGYRCPNLGGRGPTLPVLSEEIVSKDMN